MSLLAGAAVTNVTDVQFNDFYFSHTSGVWKS